MRNHRPLLAQVIQESVCGRLNVKLVSHPVVVGGQQSATERHEQEVQCYFPYPLRVVYVF